MNIFNWLPDELQSGLQKMLGELIGGLVTLLLSILLIAFGFPLILTVVFG